MSAPKFRVAICGGGISGLCLAVALSRCPSIQVDVYEATDRFKEIGAGVMIWARTWRILEKLGLGPTFSKIAHAPPSGSIEPGFDFRRSDQPEEGFRYRLVQMPFGCIRFYRVDFLDVFVDALPPGIAHFGMRLVSYSQKADTNEISLEFSNGHATTCDLLAGCDGIKSTIRAQMFTEAAERLRDDTLLKFIDPAWTGTIAYRGLIPVERLPMNHRSIASPMMYCGKSKHVVSYSISRGNIVNVVTFASKPESEGSSYSEDTQGVNCPQQELLDCYAGWEPEVEQLLSQIDNPTRWAIHHLRPLPFFVDGKIALLGDACHAMAPHEGAGAGQAIEDAFILAALLEQTTIEEIPLALKAYQRVRLPFANHVLEGSYQSGMLYEFNSDYGEDYENLGPAIEKQWDWVEEPSPEEERLRALEYFYDLASRS
ncbi:FAD/NAD-P-binding domain-containing protein [Lentinula raphanica]|uniref:FAD/NAD-P-binding domain-containing protein n=1 Tax=Lentinula raphanica TaxID=153919 RepID=A0AA38PDB5_9AGAR|nr:FAD/NAD(P)-binding domain-containing protein [Lentinula raphanica]KAJ3840568.1 FAD/NAD-P-binding domain-containing protein [Lentinula raphanica]